MIYLDCGATSFPKPQSVYREVLKTMKKCGGNPSRGSHALARCASESLFALRESAAGMFNTETENVIFTFNATHALNIAIKGLASDGCHILISDIEHNSVRRPVISLCRESGCTYDVFKSCIGDETAIISELTRKIKDNTKLLILCHRSNITNLTLPLKRIGKLCRQRGINFIVDASQSAGHCEIDLKKTEADAICMSGHKGLYGPAGTGLLLLRDGALIKPLIEGGSGTNSADDYMPDFYPDRLEAGTMSAPLAAGLRSGIEWVKKIGISAIATHESELSSLLTNYLYEINGVTVYGNGSVHGSTVLFNVDKFPSVHTGELLDRAGICVRCGLHCSPLAHQTLETPKSGAVRVSFGAFNNVDHVRRLVDELYKIIKYEN